MSTSAPGTVTGLTITDSALGKIREVMSQQQLADDERNLRVFVEGGGCCGGGPSFGLAFDRAQDDDVRMDLAGGLTVIVDPMSAPFCAGATIDYLDSGEVQGFKVNAPALQQKESGGCGSGGCGSEGGGGGCGSGGGGGGCGSGAAHEHGASHEAAKGHSHGGSGGGCGCG